MASEVTADSLVNYGGMEVTVASLEALGVVVKTADGYRDARSFSSGDAGTPPTSPSTEQANVTDTEQAPEQQPEQSAVEILLDNNGSLKGDIFNAAVDISQ